MSPEFVNQIGARINASLAVIRSRVLIQAPAVRWHVAKARAFLPLSDVTDFPISHLEKNERAEYLERLPDLIDLAERQDAACQSCWAKYLRDGDRAAFLAERERTVELLGRFRFRPLLYDRLTRQPDKPVLEQARQLLSTGHSGIELEDRLRMSLREFVDAEDAIAWEHRALDEAREELAVAYDGLAEKITAEFDGPADVLLQAARRALRKAAEMFLFDNRYRFPAYAQWWIRAAVRKAGGTKSPAAEAAEGEESEG